MKVDPRSLPEEGLQLTGEDSRDIFGLGEGPVHFIGPLQYSLFAQLVDGDLVVSGSLSCEFELECGRCLSAFPAMISIPEYHAVLPVNAGEIADLTESVREDILLALPDYPRCDEHGGAECPAQGRFPTEERFVPLDESKNLPDTGQENVWGVLDTLVKPSTENPEN